MDASRMRVVLADDDVLLREVARALLERDGMTVAGIAHNTTEAVQRAQALRRLTRGGEPVTADPHRTRRLPVYRDV